MMNWHGCISYYEQRSTSVVCDGHVFFLSNIAECEETGAMDVDLSD